MYWYVGVVVTFTTLTGAIETALTERLDKTTLNHLRRKLTAHSKKRSHSSFTDRMIYRNMDTFIRRNKKRITNGTFTNSYRKKFNGRYVRRFLNRFDKKNMSRFIGLKTDTIRKRFTGRQRC